MNNLLAIVVVIQVITALMIIGLVLLQHGKGADMGAAFGSGASGSLFGASGSSNFLSRFTAIAAAVFFASTLALSYISSRPSAGTGAGVMDQVTTPAKPAMPSSDTPAPAGSQNKASEIPK